MTSVSRRRTRDILVGMAVSAVVVAVLAVVFSPAALLDDSYEVTATFDKADGLNVGAPVRAAGIPVGEVVSLELDDRFRVRTRLRIDAATELDTEASAAIVTDGLFGAKLVQVDIGGGAGTIGDGGEIVWTADSLVLDDLLDLIIRQARAARDQSDTDVGPGASDGVAPGGDAPAMGDGPGGLQ